MPQPITRRTILSLGAGLWLEVAYAQSLDQNQDLTISALDAFVRPGDTVAYVPVQLSYPTQATIVLEYITKNGPGVYGVLRRDATSGHFLVTRRQLIFQPGERLKVVAVTMLRNLSRSQFFEMQFQDYRGYPLRKYAKASATISGGDEALSPIHKADDLPLPSRPSLDQMIFSDDLLRSNFANDRGVLQDGSPCWQSRLSHGRTQDANRELGYYADPELHPVATVWGVGEDGKRFIQAEHHPSGIIDTQGRKQINKQGIEYQYSAAVITSRTLCNNITTGCYIEVEARFSNVVGTWPAIWLLPTNGSWPPEIDLLEAFISNEKYPQDLVYSSLHWMEKDKHKVHSAPVPLHQFEDGADIFSKYNRFGCFLGERQVTFYFNDKPYCGIPNRSGKGPWYLLINIAVGGLVPRPTSIEEFPARLAISRVRVSTTK